MAENQACEETNPNRIATLIFAILQPAIAGGMEEEKAQEIYHSIMDNIFALDKTGRAFNTLLDDIINKWALSIMVEFGVKIPDKKGAGNVPNFTTN